MNIFQKTKDLNLPDGSYVVVGGGLLVALGLLEWDEDIDICVRSEIFEEFQAKGWDQEDWKGKPVLKHDIYDIGTGFGEWSLEDLQADAIVIQDVPFMSLDKLLAWKKQMARPKDLKHIALIESYQKTH
jgi:hypothetical protein